MELEDAAAVVLGKTLFVSKHVFCACVLYMMASLDWTHCIFGRYECQTRSIKSFS